MLKNYSRFILIVAVSLLFISYAQAGLLSKGSGADKKNTVGLSIFGAGAYYSLNYERTLFENPSLKTNLSIGFAYYPTIINIDPLLIPISINEFFKINEISSIVVGLGSTLVNSSPELDPISKAWKARGNATVGYRLLPGSNFFAQIEYVGILDFVGTSFNYLNWGGLKFGYSF